MNRFRSSLAFVLTVGLFWATSFAWAIDTVYVIGQEKRVAGTITDVSRDAITVKSNLGGETTIPTNEIAKIEFDGQPAQLNLVRSIERNGRYEEAITQYAEVLDDVRRLDNDALEGEIEFLIARCEVKLAEADAQRRADAAAVLKDYVGSHRTHYRYYEAQLLYGQLSVLNGDTATSNVVFKRLADAPFAEYQMAAKVAQADALFADEKFDEALPLYNAVADADAKSPGETSRKLAALLGKAKIASEKQQYDDAIATLDVIISETTAADTAVQAEAYLRQGDAYAASGAKAKAAVMAYLHVDVIPSLSRESSKHAEALYRLVELWPVVGQPSRAVEAAERLRELYPNSQWTAKLN